MTDPLSDVLRSVRLQGGLFLDARFTAPWCVTAQITPQSCAPFLPGLMQVIGYHVVLEGSMLFAVDGEPPIELRAGEIVLLPRNDVHTMASDKGVAPVSGADLVQQSPEGNLLKIRHGGGTSRPASFADFWEHRTPSTRCWTHCHESCVSTSEQPPLAIGSRVRCGLLRLNWRVAGWHHRT